MKSFLTSDNFSQATLDTLVNYLEENCKVSSQNTIKVEFDVWFYTLPQDQKMFILQKICRKIESLPLLEISLDFFEIHPNTKLDPTHMLSLIDAFAKCSTVESISLSFDLYSNNDSSMDTDDEYNPEMTNASLGTFLWKKILLNPPRPLKHLSLKEAGYAPQIINNLFSNPPTSPEENQLYINLPSSVEIYIDNGHQYLNAILNLITYGINIKNLNIIVFNDEVFSTYFLNQTDNCYTRLQTALYANTQLTNICFEEADGTFRQMENLQKFLKEISIRNQVIRLQKLGNHLEKFENLILHVASTFDFLLTTEMRSFFPKIMDKDHRSKFSLLEISMENILEKPIQVSEHFLDQFQAVTEALLFAKWLLKLKLKSAKEKFKVWSGEENFKELSESKICDKIYLYQCNLKEIAKMMEMPKEKILNSSAPTGTPDQFFQPASTSSTTTTLTAPNSYTHSSSATYGQ